MVPAPFGNEATTANLIVEALCSPRSLESRTSDAVLMLQKIKMLDRHMTG